MEQDEEIGTEARVTLAFNQHGEPIDVPGEATGWRVRRHRAGSAPEVVYSKGRPLVVPIDAAAEDLAIRVGRPGRYRLDAVDDTGRNLKVPPAFIVIDGSDLAPGGEPASSSAAETSRLLASVEALARTNAEVVQSMVGQLSQCITAAGALMVPAARQRNGIIEIVQPPPPADGSPQPPEWMGLLMGFMPALQQVLTLFGDWVQVQKAQVTTAAIAAESGR